MVAVARDTANSVFRVAAQKIPVSSSITQGTSVLRMEFVQYSNSASSTITIPSEAQPGDLAILFDTSTTTTSVVPSGWTSITNTTTTGIRSTVSRRILTSGQPGSTVTGMSGTTSKILVVFRPNAAITTVTASTPSAQATTAAPTTQSITIPSETSARLFFAHYTSTSNVGTRGMTGYVWDDPGTTQELVGGAARQYAKWFMMNKGSNEQTSSLSISQSDNGTNCLQSFSLSIS